MIGSQIDAYRLEEQLGEGTFGAVYRATSISGAGRQVAIKLVRPDLASSQTFLDALRQQCDVLAALRHPGIAGIEELIVEQGNPPAIVMELLRGENLQERLAKGALQLEETVRILRELLQALGAAHDQGVIHQDIRPGNLFLCTDGNVKVLGFGLARAADSGRAGDTGQLEGALDYLAPEVFEGLEAGAPVDIYAAGLLAWEMLTGIPACAEGSFNAKMGWHLGVDLTDIRSLRPECPAWLAKVIAILTDKNPAARPRHGTAASDVLRLQMKGGGGLSSLSSQERTFRRPPPGTVKIDKSLLPDTVYPEEVQADPPATEPPPAPRAKPPPAPRAKPAPAPRAEPVPAPRAEMPPAPRARPAPAPRARPAPAPRAEHAPAPRAKPAPAPRAMPAPAPRAKPAPAPRAKPAPAPPPQPAPAPRAKPAPAPRLETPTAPRAEQAPARRGPRLAPDALPVSRPTSPPLQAPKGRTQPPSPSPQPTNGPVPAPEPESPAAQPQPSPPSTPTPPQPNPNTAAQSDYCWPVIRPPTEITRHATPARLEGAPTTGGVHIEIVPHAVPAWPDSADHAASTWSEIAFRANPAEDAAADSLIPNHRRSQDIFRRGRQGDVRQAPARASRRERSEEKARRVRRRPPRPFRQPRGPAGLPQCGQPDAHRVDYQPGLDARRSFHGHLRAADAHRSRAGAQGDKAQEGQSGCHRGRVRFTVLCQRHRYRALRDRLDAFGPTRGAGVAGAGVSARCAPWRNPLRLW